MGPSVPIPVSSPEIVVSPSIGPVVVLIRPSLGILLVLGILNDVPYFLACVLLVALCVFKLEIYVPQGLLHMINSRGLRGSKRPWPLINHRSLIEAVFVSSFPEVPVIVIHRIYSCSFGLHNGLPVANNKNY